MDRVEYINNPNLPLFLKMPDRPCPGKQFSPIPKFFPTLLIFRNERRDPCATFAVYHVPLARTEKFKQFNENWQDVNPSHSSSAVHSAVRNETVSIVVGVIWLCIKHLIFGIHRIKCSIWNKMPVLTLNKRIKIKKCNELGGLET